MGLKVRKSISQTAIAHAAAISQTHLNNIFKDQRKPSWRVAKRLARATRTEPELWLECNGEQIWRAVVEKVPTLDDLVVLN